MESQADILRLEGVFSKGYGVVPKFVMHDRDLTLESKAIYAYLCALAGSGCQTYPYRDTILRDLGLSKNTYYRHYGPLIQQGYISVERPPDKRAANLYTLVSNPKKLQDTQPSPDKNKAWLRYRGLKSRGYGTIPRVVMTDSRLTVKAKGLYAYLCSYCGAGDCAFPRREDMLFHLGISEPTYYKALNQLKAFGYLAVWQRLDRGRFDVNDYFLCEDPESAPPGPQPRKKRGGEKQFTEPPPDITDRATTAKTNPSYPRNRDTKIPYLKIRDTKNRDTLSNNSSANNSSFNINPSSGTDQIESICHELGRRIASQPQSLQTILRQSIQMLPCLLEESRLPIAGWGVDKLWQSMIGFCRHFQTHSAGKPVRNKKAYFRAALANWLEESTLFGAAGETAASYDLSQLERLLDSGIV